MKKKSRIIMLTVVAGMLMACSGGDKEEYVKTSGSESSTEVAVLQPFEPDEESIVEDVTEEVEEAGSKYDVDLTKLSSVMVYSQVFDMTMYPDKYIGKTVKMQGTMASFEDEANGETYYACVIQDATACCQQGVEFVLADGYTYPEIYDEITVAGTFTTYMIGENKYFTLKDAVLQ